MHLTTLTFTPANAHTPQTVTVTAAQDPTRGTLHTLLHHTVASADTNYNGVSSVPDFPVTILDDRPFCGQAGQVYSMYDTNHDCTVNFADFAVFAQMWLTCTDLSKPGCTWTIAH